jgi:predicted 3-demethylubiquinone-9 3-methyltransferase (glyoxalase superfamily)
MWNQITQKVTPFLWFDGQAEEAMNFYISVFKNGRVISIARYSDAFPGMKGKVLTGVFEMNGQQYMVIDGGPMYKFTEAVSFFVNCETQAEVDELWQKLTKEGQESRCGWLKDKYGMSWQIIPDVLGKMLTDPDKVKAKRVMEAMLKMSKIETSVLQQAYDGN